MSVSTWLNCSIPGLLSVDIELITMREWSVRIPEEPIGQDQIFIYTREYKGKKEKEPRAGNAVPILSGAVKPVFKDVFIHPVGEEVADVLVFTNGLANEGGRDLHQWSLDKSAVLDGHVLRLAH